jgi:hypothetical protein
VDCEVGCQGLGFGLGGASGARRAWRVGARSFSCSPSDCEPREGNLRCGVWESGSHAGGQAQDAAGAGREAEGGQ